MAKTLDYLINHSFPIIILIITIIISLILAQDSATCPNYACPKVICDLKKKYNQKFCENVKCFGIKPEDCPLGTLYEEKLAMCGCCPGCAKFLDVGDKCERYPEEPSADPECPYQFCPLVMHRCAPGLNCPLTGPSEKTCTLPDNAQGPQACHDKRALALNGKLHWQPACESDGSYSPKQCKGEFNDGVCFCVNKEGERIYGREQWIKAANQTCGCSRKVYELRQAGNIASIHCTSDGNYEPLQCDTDTGLCYCVDAKTGRTTGAVVPENQWKQLPCFSFNFTNFNPEGEYLRICESEWAIARKISIEASLHGLQVLSGQTINCDYDGSYAPVQHIDGISSCVLKNGNLLGNNRAQQGVYQMNCQCVRDEITFNLEGIPFTKNCEEGTGTGNYDIYSAVDKFFFQCVDRDGFFFGPMAEKKFECCLRGNCTGATEETKAKCFDPSSSGDNTDKVYACSWWPT